MLNATERDALGAFRGGESAASCTPGLPSQDDWLRFGLLVLLEIGRRVRAMRLAPLAESVIFKEDGSPSLPVEIAIEAYLRQQLGQVAPHARVVGEESGGSLSGDAATAVIDPIDGTWALVNRGATYATSLAFLERGRVSLAMIANPTSGEIAYALPGGRCRLLQLACLGEPDLAFDLPLDRSPGKRILVNLHPARGGAGLAVGLQQAWESRRIGMLKGMGGSPSWGLLEAARGTFIYVNRWLVRACEPYDLAGSVFLLRQAGGEVVDLNGVPIDEFGHRGTFVAGIDRDMIAEVTALCRECLPDLGGLPTS